jgi:hypothetical protein
MNSTPPQTTTADDVSKLTPTVSFELPREPIPNWSPASPNAASVFQHAVLLDQAYRQHRSTLNASQMSSFRFHGHDFKVLQIPFTSTGGGQTYPHAGYVSCRSFFLIRNLRSLVSPLIVVLVCPEASLSDLMQKSLCIFVNRD